jgi:hypothetical protein
VSTRYEWAGTGFELLTPAEVAEEADDGNPDGDWGLAFSTGSNGCMIVGSADALRELAARIPVALAAAEEGWLV